MLAKLASMRKVVLYDGKSLKLVYLLKLAVSLHSAQVVTDLRPVKAEPTALFVSLPLATVSFVYEISGAVGDWLSHRMTVTGEELHESAV